MALCHFRYSTCKTHHEKGTPRWKVGWTLPGKAASGRLGQTAVVSREPHKDPHREPHTSPALGEGGSSPILPTFANYKTEGPKIFPRHFIFIFPAFGWNQRGRGEELPVGGRGARAGSCQTHSPPSPRWSPEFKKTLFQNAHAVVRWLCDPNNLYFLERDFEKLIFHTSGFRISLLSIICPSVVGFILTLAIANF